MLKKILKKVKSDRGSSALVSFLLLVPLFLSIVITGFDTTFYFANRGQVDAIARDAARTVAIFGGNGTASRSTTIEKSYGNSRTSACSAARSGLSTAPNKQFFTDIVNSNSTAVECNVAYNLAMSTGFVSVTFSKQPSQGGRAENGVKCGPETATSVGSRTFCEIKYNYQGLPGAPLGFIKTRGQDGNFSSPLRINNVVKSSESEVKSPLMVNR